jgi:uncharacterized protein
MSPLPIELRDQKYISLVTFKKDGRSVGTPVWFAEIDDKLYVMTRTDSGKYKRVRNSSRIKIAPCTMRGKVTGPEFSGTARILAETDWPRARAAIRAKYWLARIPFLWSKTNCYLELIVS